MHEIKSVNYSLFRFAQIAPLNLHNCFTSYNDYFKTVSVLDKNLEIDLTNEARRKFFIVLIALTSCA